MTAWSITGDMHPTDDSRKAAAANGQHGASGTSVRGPPSERSTCTGVKRGAARARVVAAVRSPAAFMFILGTVLVGQAVFDQVLPRGGSTGGLHFARRELQDAGSGEAGSGSSSSPPPPPLSPPSASDDDPRIVVVRIIASGTQADFGTDERSAIRVLFAEKAQVALDAVTVTIVAASVLITVSIDAINAAAAAAVETALEDVLTDADATTAFLQQAVPGIVVESADMKEELATSEGIDPAIIAVAAVGGVLAIGVVVAVGYYVFRKRKNVETITSTRAKADVEAQAVGFSAIPSGPKFDPHT